MVLHSAAAGAATLLGAALVVALGRPGERLLAGFLGLAGGVMLAVVLLDLLPAAGRLGGWRALAGAPFGLAVLFLLDLLLQGAGPATVVDRRRFAFLRLGYLTALGIALHDLPEGVAIAAGYAVAERLGGTITLAIALHNIPEGMATAAPLLLGGLSGQAILMLNAAVSLCTPLGAALGYWMAGISPLRLGTLLAVAAGAMLYVVLAQLLPHARRRHSRAARLGLGAGFLLFGTLTWLA